MGEGIWSRRGETPSVVSWEDRIIDVREGCWSYVAGSVGRAPERVVGTAIPKRNQEDATATWCLSTGYILTVDWDEGPGFHLHSENSDDDSEVRLLKGRKLQYKGGEQSSREEQEKDEEDGFLTLARYTPEKPDGKATALLNWRLLVAEISPEEDVVTVLLLCMVIVRSVCELRGEDVGRMLEGRGKQCQGGRIGDRWYYTRLLQELIPPSTLGHGIGMRKRCLNCPKQTTRGSRHTTIHLQMVGKGCTREGFFVNITSLRGFEVAMLVCRFYSAHIPRRMANFGGCSV